MPHSRVTASMPENLSLFLDPATRKEEGTVKKLSKDSILSLYASTPSVHNGMATHGENCGILLSVFLNMKLFNVYLISLTGPLTLSHDEHSK